MHFNSLEEILNRLEKQPGWEKFRDYRQLLNCWHNTVNKNTAQHTRPLHITRQVLWVATSSAAMAQELSFQRYTLLKRLNKQLPFILKDIRFSSSGWHQTTYEENTAEVLFKISEKQKSKNQAMPKTSLAIDFDLADRGIENNLDRSTPTVKAKKAAQRWLDKLNQNSSSWLTCPQCNSPTSKGEIERWNLCYLCVSQKWSQEYRPPTFPKTK